MPFSRTPYRIWHIAAFLIVVTTVLPDSLHAEQTYIKPGKAIVILDETPLRTEPNEEASVTHYLEIGHQLTIRKLSNFASPTKWLYVTTSIGCSSHSLCTGWVHAEALSHEENFRKITRWNGPSGIELEQGDYSGSYTFDSKGSFKHLWGGGTEGDWKTGADRGHLYRSGNVVWARDKNNQGDLFVLRDELTLCWHDDPEICATTPAPNNSVQGTGSLTLPSSRTR